MGTLGLVAGIAGILSLVVGGGLRKVDLKKGTAEGGGTPSKVLMGTGGTLLALGIALTIVAAANGSTTTPNAQPPATAAGATSSASAPLSTGHPTVDSPSIGPVAASPVVAWGPRILTFASPNISCGLTRADMDVPIVNGDNMDHHDLEWAPWCDDGGFQVDASGKSLNRSSQLSNPDPVTCKQDAQSGNLPNTYGNDLHIGETFCLLTAGGHVVWLQLTSKTGDTDGPTLAFTAIAWQAP